MLRRKIAESKDASFIPLIDVRSLTSPSRNVPSRLCRDFANLMRDGLMSTPV